MKRVRTDIRLCENRVHNSESSVGVRKKGVESVFDADV
jgi:hypothetical protein